MIEKKKKGREKGEKREKWGKREKINKEKNNKQNLILKGEKI